MIRCFDKNEYKDKLRSAEEAVRCIKSGAHVYVGTASSVAYGLCDALAGRKNELENVKILSALAGRPSDVFADTTGEHFRPSAYFLGGQERKAAAAGFGDFTSFHLSQVELWCASEGRADVAFFEVSEPDENGYMSYGPSGIALHHCIKDIAKTVICQVNKNVPYVFGERNLIHISEADMIVEADTPMATLEEMPGDEIVQAMSKMIVDLVPDGATVQLGLGGIASAVGYGLKDKNDLGIHTELMTESLMYLMKEGVVTNKKKSFMPGKSVASFAFGSNELYKYLHKNEDFYFAPFSMVNDVRTIAQNDNMISVNTAMSIDLFGQVAADSIGTKQQSGVGGQLDFVRGAQMAKGGKSFIAMASTQNSKTKGSISKIVSAFPPGTAVTTPRSDVQYVVTEYGCINLKELNMKDRVRAMISLAHPDYRDQLTAEAKQFGML